LLRSISLRSVRSSRGDRGVDEADDGSSFLAFELDAPSAAPSRGAVLVRAFEAASPPLPRFAVLAVRGAVARLPAPLPASSRGVDSPVASASLASFAGESSAAALAAERLAILLAAGVLAMVMTSGERSEGKIRKRNGRRLLADTGRMILSLQ
jgi:hypothetical protein